MSNLDNYTLKVSHIGTMTKVVPNVFVFFIYFQLTFGLQEKCEFNGRLVKIITSAEPPHVIIDEYMSKTPLIKQFGTYNVSNFVSGILVDLINQISLECNFKYEIHVDQDPHT